MQKCFHLLVCAFLSCILAGCGGSGSSNSIEDNQGGSTPAPTPTPTSEPTPTPEPTTTPIPTPNPTPIGTPTPIERPSNLSCIPPAPVFNSTDLALEPAFPDLPSLTFGDNMGPIAMQQPPENSGIWYAASRNGVISWFTNSTSATTLNTVIDISTTVSTSGERGLTGMAIHPNFPEDNRIFVLYNDSSASGRSTIASFEVNTTTNTANPSSEIQLLTLDRPSSTLFHNGGDLAFGLDGMLYASFGDALFANFSQALNNLHGTIIRVDVSGSEYTIPNDNPFNTGQARCDTGTSTGANCPEIFAYGFRNPWRFSIDQVTGQLWVGDVGEDTFEEVDRVISGGNYGWPIMEANQCSNPGCDTTGLELPVTQYGRSQGVSITGGYVYRGPSIPSLQGTYIFNDTFPGRLFSVAADADIGTPVNELLSPPGTIAAAAQSNNGEIFFLNLNGSDGGNIFQLTASGNSTVIMPTNLSDTGCFDTESKTHAQGVFEYEINNELWTDGAEKRRAFAIPDTSSINVIEDGDFEFPENSILIKHFLDGSTYLETRLFVHHPAPVNWIGYSYQWNNAQTQATLVAGNEPIDIPSTNFTHTIPSRSQCLECHTQAANESLGIESLQLNRDNARIEQNQLDFLSNAGYINTVLNPANEPQLSSLNDASATLAARARSYLHSNCSGCHRPGGSRIADMDLRFTTSFANTFTCNVEAELTNFGIPNANRIEPGDPDSSVIVLRMEDLGSNRMPPLGTNLIHTQATDIIRSWITTMSDCN